MEQVIEFAIFKAGGQSALAAALGMKPQAVQQWQKVPPKWVISVARATDFAVTPHELRPDIYPHPDDGLPPERRTREAAA